MFSASSCPVLTIVRTDYLRIFFSWLAYKSLFQGCALDCQLWTGSHSQNVWAAFFFFFCNVKQFLRGRIKSSAGMSRGILLHEDTVGKFIIFCSLMFSRGSIRLCKQRIKVIPCRKSLVM